MFRPKCFLMLALAGGAALPLLAGDEPLVFRSEVSLVRVDVQVLDRDNRAITGLTPQDFILREEGRPQPIRNFGTENLPIDVLLLFDVSASMRPHVERIASAGHEAFRVLGAQDRIGIMVFDRSTRVRLSFRSNPQEVERELERLLKQEGFNGGTDITRGLLDAARYIGREGRRDARKAIVIVTDDETEMERDEAAVSAALTRADAVLCALIAPDAMPQWTRRRGNSGPWGNGGSWPGGGGGRGGVGMGGPLGGIILGRRGGYGGRGGGPGMHGGGTHSAGTAEIARQSGGDSMPVDDAYALENTLSRLRQRYALHFYVPPGVKAGEERTIEVALADTARRRYPEADVRYRRTYIASVGTGAADPGTVVTQTSSEPATPARTTPSQELKRRPAVDGSSGGSTQGPLIAVEPPPQPEKQPPQQASPAPAPSSDKTQTQHGGWRRLKPGEQP